MARSSTARQPATLTGFHPAVAEWFARTFAAPTDAQRLGWAPLLRGESTLLLAPTGSGKTLAAFLHAIDRLMFHRPEGAPDGTRVLYVSPLKALAVDVERNLRAPLVGIGNVARDRGDAFHAPSVWVRTGDTPARERARFARHGADIVITTPESLYLALTSEARHQLAAVETVIIDEIHALVSTKRGAHLALSLERLERLTGRRVQRVGLSATQRPLEEVARFLGGVEAPRPSADVGDEAQLLDEPARGRIAPSYRSVTIVDAGHRKNLALRIEVPVEDMAALGKPVDLPSGPAAQGPVRTTIWTAIHPRLVELVRAHTSTIVFVNSRRIAERLAAAMNELAGEPLVHAHHGSLAPPQRAELEDRLKTGAVRGLIATSSLELGIDMGAVDLVIQIEAPPSVASGLQRVGRAGHQVGAISRGVVFPKYRGDLLACAAVARAMQEGDVEPIRYPRNPLDVLAQQIVAMVGVEPWGVDELYTVVRKAAPYAELGRGVFDGLLDMLAGRYESDEFAELRPRLVWDRVSQRLTAREGAKRIAITSGGTIPDRGLYGVYLAGASGKAGARVGELDEEMVFESRPGETFVLGASTWRIEEITHDRVLVTPAPGAPGKMPFWRGESAGRTVQIGRAMGELVRKLDGMPRAAARTWLSARHGLEERAAENLLAFLADQKDATEVVPDDRTIVIETTRDELGDYRLCVLSPLGGRVHAPWAMAASTRIRERTGVEVETMWGNDGFVVRFPEGDEPPDPSLLLPEPGEVEALVLRQLGTTALFAARFREAAARALLLPRRYPGKRAPLWQTRKRAATLLGVAARHGSFPMLLEAHRECLRDEFDLPALVELLTAVARGTVKVKALVSQVPSPFASSLLFGWVANYIYEGDAPLAERRAQALAIDHAQLRELLGEAELRELLDPEAIAAVEAELQHLPQVRRARSADGVHDLLLRLGDLSAEEIAARALDAGVARTIDGLVATRRAIEVRIAGDRRFVAVEHASRLRDALGVALPPGLPEAFLRSVAEPALDLLSRYARTHGPFASSEPAARLGLPRETVEASLARLVQEGRLVEGAFRPGGHGRELCDPDVLRAIRRRSLAKLRREVEPVEPAALARFLLRWHGVVNPSEGDAQPVRRRTGLDAVLDAVERLQGAALPASLLESAFLPARVPGYFPGDLDELAAAGEVVWVGVGSLGPHDGRVAVYLTDALPQLVRSANVDESTLDERERAVLAFLRREGASFFAAIHDGTGGGFPTPTVDALWSLAFRGLVTNDTFRALRAHVRAQPARRGRRGTAPRGYRSRRLVPPEAEGRWSLVASRLGSAAANDTTRATAIAQQLLARWGLVTRDVLALEDVPGGFTAIYEVLRAMEDAGRIRRGLFVAGLAATQFALPAALELLRAQRVVANEEPEVHVLAAVDPANPYGAVLPWPDEHAREHGLARAVGAHVVLVDGGLAAYAARGGRGARVWLPDAEPDRGRVARAVAASLAELARGHDRRDGAMLEEIDGEPAGEHPLSDALVDAGFVRMAGGLLMRRH